jgi:hypothetical protein
MIRSGTLPAAWRSTGDAIPMEDTTAGSTRRLVGQLSVPEGETPSRDGAIPWHVNRLEPVCTPMSPVLAPVPISITS